MNQGEKTTYTWQALRQIIKQILQEVEALFYIGINNLGAIRVR
jgi:hypothetical protein